MINSILKAIDIVELFSPDEPRLALGEISRRLDMPKSTAHNLLNTLVSRGFVEKVDGDCYALGTAIITLTHAVRVNVELRDRAAHLIRRLGDECGETVYLTALEGDQALYIYAVESSHRLLARTAVGDRVQLHCTSVGKAMLSCMSDDEVRGVVERVGLPSYTPNTVTSLDRLFPELEATRARGYSVDREEHEIGVYCLGAPILNDRGRVVGACSISGVDPEIHGSRMPDLSSLIVHTGREISARMGYVPPRQQLRPVLQRNDSIPPDAPARKELT